MARSLRPYPPPLELYGHRNVFFKQPKADFFLQTIFGLNQPYFLENIVTTKQKYLPTNFNVICPYFDKLSKVKSFLFLKEQFLANTQVKYKHPQRFADTFFLHVFIQRCRSISSKKIFNKLVKIIYHWYIGLSGSSKENYFTLVLFS